MQRKVVIGSSDDTGLFGPAKTVVRSILANQRLVVSLVYRELRESAAGSILGWLWLVLVPLCTVAVYLFLFAFVLRVRMTGPEAATQGDYTLYILAGLVPWLMTADVMSRACGTIITHSSIVKEIVFPVEVLPVRAYFVAAIAFTASYCLLIGYALFSTGLSGTWLLLPIAIGVQAVFLIGISMMFAAITPFFRDWAKITILLTQFTVYLTPIVFVIDWLPATIRILFYLNPFSYMVWVFQDVIFHGAIVKPYAWVVFTIIAGATFCWGSGVFMKLKPQFGNVL